MFIANSVRTNTSPLRYMYKHWMNEWMNDFITIWELPVLWPMYIALKVITHIWVFPMMCIRLLVWWVLVCTHDKILHVCSQWRVFMKWLIYSILPEILCSICLLCFHCWSSSLDPCLWFGRYFSITLTGFSLLKI